VRQAAYYQNVITVVQNRTDINILKTLDRHICLNTST